MTRTTRFAWLPVRLRSGRWVWLRKYRWVSWP